MKSWREEYIKALQARDTLEKSQEHYIHAYTKLADRAASSENAIHNPTSTERHPGDNFTESLYRSSSKDDRATATPNAQSQQQKLMTDLRKNLSKTQHVRADLEEKVGVMATKIDQMAADLLMRKRLIDELSKEKTSLEWKLRDRDEEIKGKTRLVEEVQNEMISLNLQLNMVEQRSEKLEKENKELVERWMRLKGREADDMNKASDWR